MRKYLGQHSCMNEIHISYSIDLSINGLRKSGYFKNVNITTDPNTAENYSKLIDFVIRIELTRTILSPRLSDFLRNSTIHFACFYIW